MTILVIEDDTDCRDALVASLASAGYHAYPVPDGLEAVRTLVNGLRPDVIVLDLMLPVMDGYRVFEFLQADPDLRRIPVVVASANAYDQRLANAASYLRKPFRASDLLERIRAHGRRGRGSEGEGNQSQHA